MTRAGVYTITTPVYGGSQPRGDSPRPRQAHDLAGSSAEHDRHWQSADGLAAVSSATPSARATMRRKCRYECLNNSYARGLVLTLARDMVGVSPRLQLMTDDDRFNSHVEAEFAEWSDRVHLGDKLRLLEATRARDGECFGLFFSNPNLEVDGLPAVDLKLFEADQVAHPWGKSWWAEPSGDDGIECDANGLPVRYHFLKSHPGDNRAMTGRFDSVLVPAADVVHWHHADRPGQLRGLPELAPAMPLFAYLRRLTLAVLGREEVAASTAAVLETDLPPENYEESSQLQAFDKVAITRNALRALPHGWRLHQLQTDRPAQAHGQLVDSILREIGRSCAVPLIVLTGDASKHNYSSARLDTTGYYDRLRCHRSTFRSAVLDRIFSKWWEEFRLLDPRAFVAWRQARMPARRWHFDAPPSIDPLKEAAANEAALLNGSTSLTAISAAAGRDIEDTIAELKRERDLFLRAGLPLPPHLRGDSAPTGRSSQQAAEDREAAEGRESEAARAD